MSSGTETVATDFYGGYSITLPAELIPSRSFIGMGDTSKEFGINDGESLVWDIVLQPEAKILDIAVVSAGRVLSKTLNK